MKAEQIDIPEGEESWQVGGTVFLETVHKAVSDVMTAYFQQAFEEGELTICTSDEDEGGYLITFWAFDNDLCVTWNLDKFLSEIDPGMFDEEVIDRLANLLEQHAKRLRAVKASAIKARGAKAW